MKKSSTYPLHGVLRDRVLVARFIVSVVKRPYLLGIYLASRIIPANKVLPGIATTEDFRTDLLHQWLHDVQEVEGLTHKLCFAFLRIPDAIVIRYHFGKLLEPKRAHSVVYTC
jgi:hypothetical protein